MIKLLPLLFISISIQTFGQSETFKGKIVADSLQGYAINIVNFTKKIGTTNDDQGFFDIPAVVGDSIIFSSIQYQIRSIVVKEIQLQGNTVMIALSPLIQKLEQVKLSNIQLSGNLNKDAGNIELMPFVDNQILGLPFSDRPQPTLAERRIYTAKSGIIERPINYLNGTIKKLKRIKQIEDLNTKVQRAQTTFTNAFFVDSLGVPKNLILDFMYYCAEDETFDMLLDLQKRLLLLEFFQEKSKHYKIHKEIK